jgi:hypothetical protein
MIVLAPAPFAIVRKIIAEIKINRVFFNVLTSVFFTRYKNKVIE